MTTFRFILKLITIQELFHCVCRNTICISIVISILDTKMAMVNKKQIKELLNESACSHNEKKKSSCDKPKPGASSGGCAFEGAQIALFPFADVVHLVHSPATCLGASWETRATPSSWDGENNTYMGYCTDITTNDVIFGGNKKLEESIEYIIQTKNPKR